MLWNRYHERLLKKWSSTSKVYSVLHTNSAKYFSNWNKKLGIPAILIGSLTASSIFSSEVNTSLYWTYANGGMALLVTALAGIQNFLGFSEKCTKHQTASFKYTKIGMDIDTLLTFDRDERKEPPEVFLPKIKEHILEIRENCPEILSWILEDYLENQSKSVLNDISSEANKKYSYRENHQKNPHTRQREENNIDDEQTMPAHRPNREQEPDIENQLNNINVIDDIDSLDGDIESDHTPNKKLKKNLLNTIEQCTMTDDESDDENRSLPVDFDEREKRRRELEDNQL